MVYLAEVGVKNDKAGHVRRDHFVKLVLPFASRNPEPPTASQQAKHNR